MSTFEKKPQASPDIVTADNVSYDNSDSGLAADDVKEAIDEIAAAGTGDISGSGTANELAYFTAEKTIDNLPVATYPSLAEVSYVKGVTSAIQSQLNGKQASGSYEVTTNKETSALDTSTTKYPCNNVVKEAVDAKAPSANPTFTGTVTLPKTLEIQDTSADHQYVLAVNELTADRTVTLPLLTGNDEFTFNAHTQTLTNKRITKRVATTTDDATAVIDIDACDVYELSAIANATEFSTTGTPTDGQTLMIRFKDAGVAKAITWNAIFVAIGVTAPTTTVAGKWHYVGCQYNSAATKWHILATGVQA